MDMPVDWLPDEYEPGLPVPPSSRCCATRSRQIVHVPFDSELIRKKKTDWGKGIKLERTCGLLSASGFKKEWERRTCTC